MELKKIYKLAKKHRSFLLFWMLTGVIGATAIYFLPDKYTASGSFYVKRTVDTNNSFFTYEGYYGQQVALSYTNTVTALLESIDLQSRALEKLNIDVNEHTLRKYSKYINVKKKGPQLVTLTVKGNDGKSANNLWMALSQELSSATNNLNVNGDNKLSVSNVSEQPVVKKVYKSLWLNIPVGILMGMSAGLFLIALKEYE